MAVPTTYTEDELAGFMHSVLGAIAGVLVFTTPGSYAEAVNEALTKNGGAAIADVTSVAGITKLRALARVEAWSLACDGAAARYSTSADGTALSRDQLFAHCKDQLSRFRTAALAYDPSYCVNVTEVAFEDDPYRHKAIQ